MLFFLRKKASLEVWCVFPYCTAKVMIPEIRCSGFFPTLCKCHLHGRIWTDSLETLQRCYFYSSWIFNAAGADAETQCRCLNVKRQLWKTKTDLQHSRSVLFIKMLGLNVANHVCMAFGELVWFVHSGWNLVCGLWSMATVSLNVSPNTFGLHFFMGYTFISLLEFTHFFFYYTTFKSRVV